MRLCVAVLSLIIVSGITGSSLQARFSGWAKMAHAHPSSSEYLAFTAPIQAQEQEQQSQQTVNALTAAQLSALNESAQADRDDRKALHDQLYQLTVTETAHYNAVIDRLDVDEARFNTGVSVVGGLLILLNGFLTISHFLTWRDKKKLIQTP